MEEMAKQVVDALKQRQQTVTFVESLTCGLAASCLGSVSGASAVFLGSVVTYSNQIKEKLGVPKEVLNRVGAVSACCAKAMAESGQAWIGSDYALSFTGVAGPHSLEGKAVGEVYIALATPEHTVTKHYHFQGNREAIRQQAVKAGYRLLLATLS